jgi:hypothetical protein
MWDYVRMGYWAVLPYEAVRRLPHLRLAPAGVVPQRDRRPRPIMDYSYYSINQHSFPLHPAHAMQFGATLQRILQRLVYSNPCHGPPLLAKVDLADGYYRVPISATASQQLAVLIPNDAPSPSPPLVAFPLTLPMGWAHSPPILLRVHGNNYRHDQCRGYTSESATTSSPFYFATPCSTPRSIFP